MLEEFSAKLAAYDKNAMKDELKMSYTLLDVQTKIINSHYMMVDDLRPSVDPLTQQKAILELIE